jgi:hypothetical protein
MSQEIEQARALMNEVGIGDLPLESVAQLFQNGITLSDLRASGVELFLKNDWQDSLKVIDAILADFDFSRSAGLARRVKISSTDELLRLIKRLHLALQAGHYAVEGGIRTR